MRIGGLTKQSFIDWEGKITAVVFTTGCNFRCGYCHNPSLVLPELFEEPIPEQNFFDYLESRTGWLDGVVVTGGEPTIQPDLKDFIKRIKSLGFAVKLDTNGTNFNLLKELIGENLVDFVAMDIKSVLTLETYQKVTGRISSEKFQNVMQSINLLRTNIVDHQFRTTVVPGIHDQTMIEQMQQIFCGENYILQQFRAEFGLVENLIHATD
ncbi:MAG: anaerobic ribonucleoside-triphosphate reductase activating protein [Paludibacter sp.]|nr:anaerobic ribonucleoside-triphosphate reductase activating protein [Paludibacter sp.]